MKKRIVATVLAGLMLTTLLAACNKTNDKTTPTKNNTSTEQNASKETENKQAKGKVTLAGSTSMEKLCEAMSESYMQENPNMVVTVEYTGSGAGLESLAKGAVQIGNASRGLKDAEKKNGLVENIVAIDGIAVIANKNNSLKDISQTDLIKIYKGEITNWKDIGGKDEAIVVLGREAGSGTRDAFEELLKVKDKCRYAQELDSTGAVLAKVAKTAGAIGYVSLDVVNDTVTGLLIDSVEPTEQQILAGKYKLQRPFVMATKGKISEQDENVQAWFNYLHSEQGKAVIKKVGLIIPEK